MFQLAVCNSTVAAADACGSSLFASESVHFGTPDLSWKPANGATEYAVDLTTRVPEGAVLARRAFRTQSPTAGRPSLDPARPTKITLGITPICGTAEGTKSTRSMLVLPAPSCAPVSGLVSEGTGSNRSIGWTATANEFEVRVHDPASGALLASHTLRERRLSGIASADPVVISVRPVCDAMLGPATYLYAD